MMYAQHHFWLKKIPKKLKFLGILGVWSMFCASISVENIFIVCIMNWVDFWVYFATFNNYFAGWMISSAKRGTFSVDYK